MTTNKTKAPASRSSRALLFLGLILAVVAAVLVFVAVNQGGGGEGEAAPTSTKAVVVANKDIAARTEVTGGMLSVKQVPADQALRGAFTDTEQVVGQVTRQDILEGEQITASKVGPQTKAEREEGLSFVLPSGKRAFSIEVSEVSAVGGLLLPGDLVDVIGVFQKDDVGVDKAVTLLQNIEVLAVAQESQESVPAPASEATATPESNGTGEEAASTLGTRPEDVKPNPKAKTVTLAVTPEQAQLLALTQARGDLALALRPYGDAAQVNLNETNLIPMGALPEAR